MQPMTFSVEESSPPNSIEFRWFLQWLDNDGLISQTYFVECSQKDIAVSELITMGYKLVLSDTQKEQLIADWNNADQQQRFWKDKENNLRKQLVEIYYTKTKGTENVTLRGDWILQIERGEDYKLENGHNETFDIVDTIPEDIAALLIRWKPELIVKNYNASAPEIQEKFAPVLTIKPSSPQVKLLPPKIPVQR